VALIQYVIYCTHTAHTNVYMFPVQLQSFLKSAQRLWEVVSGKAEEHVSLNCSKCSAHVGQFEVHVLCQTLWTVFSFSANELITSLVGKF